VSPAETAVGAPEIPVQLTKTRGGTPMAVGVMQARDLRGSFVVPRRDSRKREGYQREVSTARVNRLVKRLKENKVDLPTSILVNLREFDPVNHLIERNGQNFFIPDGEPLYVVDGQHRVEALARLVDDDEDRWGKFEIPFVCLLGARETEEMKQFYVVNSTAKSVRTDLALDLLKQRAENEPGLMESLEESGESWKVKGQTLVEELKHSSVWRGLIRFPNEPKGDTTINSAGMVSSLKGLLATPYFGAISTENQIKVLDAYWKGIRNVIPEVFDEPNEYAIQKSIGAAIMHGVLVTVLEYVRSMGKSVIDPETYENVLKDVLLTLEGDTGTGELAQGADFWRSGREGAAGSYSSSAGRRVLTAKIKGMLPDIEVE
jgi:DGQHR domain-containing protein